MKRKYEQSYRSEWEQNPTFSMWLCKSKEDDHSAYCKACNCKILPRVASLKEHSSSAKHKKCIIGFSGSSQIDKYLKNTSLSDEVKKAEIRIVATLLEHNIPFRVMDHLSDVITMSFHDSEIAKKFLCKRTKSAAIAYNVLGKNFEKIMHEDLQHGLSSFSIIIDESTDVSTTKVLAIAIKFYSVRSYTVKTMFLCTIDIQGESAQDLFNALNSALIDRGLNLKQMIGFAADTTNVMFGVNAGIIAKIQQLNPDCIYVKCVCHSVALAVSYACKILPRSVEQLVKEVYNYFSQSSKRQREFAKFQDFTNLEHHKILRHYDIRWLSLHGCISRILEQWPALKLFFQGQYLEDRKQNVSSEFLYNCFNDDLIKLFICFLDYILPITNKFNTIFQGDYPVVHRLYRDMSGMFSSIVSCYMKSNYVKTTSVSNIDPKASLYFVPINNMYLGVNVAKHLVNLKGKMPKEKINNFLICCQSFLIELSVQLKSRLPLENDIFKELTFLDPQIVVYGEFNSLFTLLSKFPNLIPENERQHIDNEYRELKIDADVGNLLSSGSNANDFVDVEKFWANVGKISDGNKKLKYTNICNFAKQMLCLPVSNVKCERIFSEINRIKTKDRNRFTNKNVSAIIHAKEGLKNFGECYKFNPDLNMLKSMNDKQLYKDVKYDDE